MEKGVYKLILPLFILTIISFVMINSSLAKVNTQIKIQNENETANKKILESYIAKKAEEEKINKKNYLMGKFDPTQREDFVLVPEQYSLGGLQMYLRNETLHAFVLMAQVAAVDDVDLMIASATRNFDYQKNLWNNKWTGATIVNGKNLSTSFPDGLDRFNKILEYSAAPSTSRHHWGTEIDINNANPEYFETARGIKVYNWLVTNAKQFGFCQPYTQKGTNRPTGYNEEKWHWSYLPLAKDFTQEYKELITDKDIAGFDGDGSAASLDLINKYVMGINPDCL